MKTRLLCLMLLITTALFSQDITIGTQTWQGANLNVGTMIPNTQAPADNNTVEKYCYGNLETNCTIYGGLYRWDEMMNSSLLVLKFCSLIYRVYLWNVQMQHNSGTPTGGCTG